MSQLLAKLQLKGGSWVCLQLLLEVDGPLSPEHCPAKAAAGTRPEGVHRDESHI